VLEYRVTRGSRAHDSRFCYKNVTIGSRGGCIGISIFTVSCFPEGRLDDVLCDHESGIPESGSQLVSSPMVNLNRGNCPLGTPPHGRCPDWGTGSKILIASLYITDSDCSIAIA
jgi:hypothetical protein